MASPSAISSARNRLPSAVISDSSSTFHAIDSTYPEPVTAAGAPLTVTGHEYGLLVATVLLSDSSFANLRDWLESDDGRAWQRRNRASPAPYGVATSAAIVVGLVVDAVREIAGKFDEISPERPGSVWKLATATADEQTGLTVHLRIGDAGDLDLLVDRALIVLGFRIEIRDRM